MSFPGGAATTDSCARKPRACELHSGSANEDRVRHGVGLSELTVKLLPAALRYVDTPLLKRYLSRGERGIFLFLVEICLE